MILMQENSDNSVFEKVNFLVGDPDIVRQMKSIPAKKPFDDEVCLFLNELSGKLNSVNSSRLPDITTLAFWIRKASLSKMKTRFDKGASSIRLGRGVIFHISPSNVPVNFAYSLIAGLVTGNANVVRVPSKDFEQVERISQAINEVLEGHEELKPYIALVRYGRDKEVNDYFSEIADVRVVWGGDETIAELRKSPIGSRTTEVTFADRYSLAIIDSDAYLADYDKAIVAQDFYNDTYLTDQNACTSPFLIVWTGSMIQQAKERFWDALYELVKEKYYFQDIQAVNKLTSSYLTLVYCTDAKVVPNQDNLIVRVQLRELDNTLYRLKDNSGFFLEYDCSNIHELISVCNNVKCQTISYIGNGGKLISLIEAGIKGIDRIVPIGKTMGFDLIWDGYDLVDSFTRIISYS